MSSINNEQVVRRYLRAMEAGDLDATVACFDADGIICSPVYGEVPVRPFYQKLFDDTVSVRVRVHNVYSSTSEPSSWAAHFAYQWVRKDGSTTDTDLVDLFEFGGSSGLIVRLRIVFVPDDKPGS